MAQEDEDEIPAIARPDAGTLGYDLGEALAAVVSVRAEIPEDAFTAPGLGTERRGNGVVIDKGGLILTIGYLVTEAERIWITTSRGQATAGHVLAIDQATGFGLVQTLSRLDLVSLRLGRSDALELGGPLVMAGGRGTRDALSARLVGRRPFAGYWEYFIDQALFTAPAHPHWGGAACIDPDGRLVGIGSLLVQEAGSSSQPVVGNMVVPVDLLLPILDDMRRMGHADRPPRPWLGLFATDGRDGVVVTGTAATGPAAKAGIEEGDLLLSLDGTELADLADLWRRLWAAGEVGVRVSLVVGRGGRRHEFGVTTDDRNRFLRRPSLH